MAEIVVEGLSYRYPGAVAPTLNDLSFNVAHGGSLALLGSSGAGKTTLLNLLSGLLPMDAGSIRFDNNEVSELSAARRGVAQVFQFPVLYDSLSVLENLAFPLRSLGYSRIARRRRAAEIAELLGIDDWSEVKPRELSLYQKQLTGFAKALVRPEVALVLLDEPLTAVEPAIKWRLRVAVKRAQEELAATMIYVTHDQTEALTFADRVSLLHDGRVLQTGTPAELYEKPQHEEVARFIGSPGMNLVEVEIVDGRVLLRAESKSVPVGAAPGVADGPATLGFRPEWAELKSDLQRSGDGFAVRVVATRLAGADVGIAQGFVSIALGAQRAQVWRQLDFDPSEPLHFSLARHELFRNGWRLS